MKPFDHTTATQGVPSLAEIARWPQVLQQLHARLAPYFARPQPHRHALLYLQAIISEIPRKNGWQIAEHAGHLHPYAMQRLLSWACWDQEGVCRELRAFVAQTLLPSEPASPSSQEAATVPGAVVIVDESAFPKRGHHSAGVAPQYCGRTGRLENCQVGVFLSYVTALGHGLIDRELYLPEAWCQDWPRRQAVHIPDTLSFHTKPELAIAMLKRTQASGLPIDWVVGDTVYGHSTSLRNWLTTQGLSYVLGVPSHEVVAVWTPQGARLGSVADLVQELVGPHDWQRLSQSEGTKGPRLFDWALLPLLQGGSPDQRHWLLCRRCLDPPHPRAYFLVWAPLGTPLPLLVQVAGTRWHMEEDLQTAKDCGLDHYEVRSYLGWYRHLTLVLLACAFLQRLSREPTSSRPPTPPAAQAPALSAPAGAAPPSPLSHQPPTPACSLTPTATPPVPLLALTLREIRHLLACLIWPAPSAAPLLCHWSWWRRTHQYWAGYYHRRRREKAAGA